MNNIKPDFLDEIFTEEWYNDVSKAADLALEHSEKLNMSEDEVIRYIIDYNITKRLQEQVLDTLVSKLPKVIDWRGMIITEAFLEFKDIIDSCNICDKFKTYKARINLNSNQLLNEFYIWKELVNSDYPRLFVSITPTKTKNTYKLEVKKIK
ncbi:MAG: hypothetical protein ACI4V7_00970 [Succinivibrionaceae bacterium]